MALSPPAIAIENLRKQYPRGRIALDGLSLSVPSGSICGLVGPNGAGKTTTINILVGLVQATEGNIFVLGQDVRRFPRRGHGQIGVAFDSHPFIPTFSARLNLRLLAKLNPDPLDVDRLEMLLSLVGLSQRAEDPVGAFSKGMVQRLSVAAALLHEPELVLLDEPFSGLDPVGAHDLRTVIQTLRQAGKTVVVSSHQLNEVEAICDSVVLLRDGRVIRQGALASLLVDGGVSVLTPDLNHAAEVLRAAGYECAIEPPSIVVKGGSPGVINALLVKGGIEVTELKQLKSTLEDAFFDLL